MNGLALHLVKSVAASPQQVSLFLAKPGRLEQGPERNESAFEAKINQAINGRHLKECNLTVLLINIALCSAEVKNGWSYTFNPPCAFMAFMWTPLLILLFISLFINSIPKSTYRSSSNGHKNSQRISNLAPCNREPVTKIGNLE